MSAIGFTAGRIGTGLGTAGFGIAFETKFAAASGFIGAAAGVAFCPNFPAFGFIAFHSARPPPSRFGSVPTSRPIDPGTPPARQFPRCPSGVEFGFAVRTGAVGCAMFAAPGAGAAPRGTTGVRHGDRPALVPIASPSAV